VDRVIAVPDLLFFGAFLFPKLTSVGPKNRNTQLQYVKVKAIGFCPVFRLGNTMANAIQDVTFKIRQFSLYNVVIVLTAIAHYVSWCQG
jgi:hypothetical protein